MVLNNIEIIVADCLLNLSRSDKANKALLPKKRIHDILALENCQSKRSRIHHPIESSQLMDGFTESMTRHLFLENGGPRSHCLPAQLPGSSPMAPTMLRGRGAYPVGRLQTHPFSPFSHYRGEYLRDGPGTPYAVNKGAIASWESIKVPVSPGSRSSAEIESIEDVDDQEESGAASIVSESSTSVVTENEASAFLGTDGEIEPTSDDVLIGTGRTCSGHEGNKRFHREIYESCEEYFRADYKKGIVERVIHSVHKRGGRFLANAKKGPWRLVVDMDRLERNTRKSFHMARKQREKETQNVIPSQNDISKLGSTLQQETQHVAVYVPEVRSFCTGWIERRRSNGDLFVRFSDRRFGADWLDVATADIRNLSR